MNLRDMLIREEGWRHEAYPDPLSKGPPWTIGVGHTGPEVHEHLVWSDDLISRTLDADISAASVECQHYFIPWFQHLSEPRQAVLVGMVFQLGIGRTRQFKQAIAALKVDDYSTAAAELLDSLWARQTPARAHRMAAQLLSGEWQHKGTP